MTFATGMALAVSTAVFSIMAVEVHRSRWNEHRLRARGALEAERDVYPLMRLAYPAGFAAMALEGSVVGPGSVPWVFTGVAIFALAKALKFWAIAALGPRWTFRVLVVPGEPLIVSGPYRYLRHPNYVAVCGEFIGASLMLGAPIAGGLSLVGFGWLIARRIAVEEQMLGLR